MNKKVEVISYHPNWPLLYQQEAEKIQKEIGQYIGEIHHIGSTAIPNMPAKPVIDIMIELNNIDDIEVIKNKLNLLGYANVHRHIIPHWSFFTNRLTENISFNLHIRERGDPQIKRHVNFRDYLIHHPEDANKYAELKKNLANKYPNDIFNYVCGKDRLIQEIDAKAKHWEGRRKDFLLQSRGAVAKNWSQEKIIKAMEANLNVHMTHFAQYLNQVELIRIPGYTLVSSGLPDDTFNYVLETDFTWYRPCETEEEIKEKIGEATRYFTDKNLPFSWWVSPYDKPNNLAEILEKVGYQNTENNIAMYLDLDAWQSQSISIPGLEIIRATDGRTLRDFALVLTNDKTSFEKYFSWVATVLTDDDPIEFFVGYVEGKPVVRGLSCYFAGVVGLHWLSTASNERKKGYARAMQQFRLQRAKKLGYHLAVLQASNEGLPVYQKMGYNECGVFREFKLKR
ncbi:MAG: acetyltransferase [uncultured bacterium]|nr:MAG: acetyltransferase [uncultured bacterium]